jgi:hypothetical protein
LVVVECEGADSVVRDMGDDFLASFSFSFFYGPGGLRRQRPP